MWVLHGNIWMKGVLSCTGLGGHGLAGLGLHGRGWVWMVRVQGLWLGSGWARTWTGATPLCTTPQHTGGTQSVSCVFGVEGREAYFIYIHCQLL